jgi:ubiquinone/menaquinone biosynthesis C-methylase UbiE
MGLYADQIFPRLMDWVLGREAFARLRAALLKGVSGDVLEIGFGTGLNLPHYLGRISHLTVVDTSYALSRKVRSRVASAPFPIHADYVTAEALPFPDRRFDAVVSTWTLCSIAEPVRALCEVRRVLKPDGRFLFLEHGRSDDPSVAAWQDRLNPVQNVIGCGCNLNRRIDRLIEQSGLVIGRLDRFQMEAVPRLAGEMYQGWAAPTAEAAAR